MSELFLTAHDSLLLRDVERAYSIEQKIAELELVFRLESIDPFKVFRSHLARASDVVTGRDVIWREQLDLLLGALSALHAGGLSAGAKVRWSDARGQFIWEILCHPAVAAYYEQHYPLAPPLLVRAAGEERLPDRYLSQWGEEIAHPDFDSAYRKFLHLDARFRANDVIGHFLELLDDFFVFGTHLSEFEWVLEQPSRLPHWLKKVPDRWQILEGMASFYEFAIDLNEYLSGLDLPILRGHVWLHFAYWFGVGGKRMDEVAHWVQAAATDPLNGYSARDELAEALIHLRDPKRYPLTLIELTREVLSPWLASSGLSERLQPNRR